MPTAIAPSRVTVTSRGASTGSTTGARGSAGGGPPIATPRPDPALVKGQRGAVRDRGLRPPPTICDVDAEIGEREQPRAGVGGLAP